MTDKFELSFANGISRRTFLKLSSTSPLAMSQQGGAYGVGESSPLPGPGKDAGSAQTTDFQTAIRQFLTPRCLTRQEVETYLDPHQPNWARFDPVMGYVLRDSVIKNGMDQSRTFETYVKTGERITINGAHAPCRINTYGDSFTQCSQASNGETWQEYLAAHLGEPIRNFGIGGYGSYQAYRRMLREEATAHQAEYLILNIWSIDDHLRSIDAWRWLRFAEMWRKVPGSLYMVHGNPWAHVRLELQTGDLIEIENPFPTPDSLWKLTDPEFVYEHFKDDLVVKLLVTEWNGAAANRDELAALAKALEVKTDFSSPKATSATALAVRIEYGLRAGIKIIEKANTFAREKNKKLMVVLSYGGNTVSQACEGLPRPDQSVVDFLQAQSIPFVDGLQKHVEDFQAFKISPNDYARRYYVGHYNPRGNHFFAFAIKDAVVAWLDPKPLAYRSGSATIPPGA
jgi:hypothetical protein